MIFLTFETLPVLSSTSCDLGTTILSVAIVRWQLICINLSRS